MKATINLKGLSLQSAEGNNHKANPIKKTQHSTKEKSHLYRQRDNYKDNSIKQTQHATNEKLNVHGRAKNSFPDFEDNSEGIHGNSETLYDYGQEFDCENATEGRISINP